MYPIIATSNSPTVVVTVTFTQSAYDITEGGRSVALCVKVSSVPTQGLERDLFVNLLFISGPIAGEMIHKRMHLKIIWFACVKICDIV